MSLDTENENFVFEDSNHNNYLLEKLNTLRKSRRFCDVILQVGTPQDVHEIYAHRCILASASKYFLEIFFTNDSSSASAGIPQIQLYKLLSNKYDVTAFNYLLDFIYTSRLEIPKKHVRNVYALSSRLKMTSISQKCGEFLASTLTAETSLTIRSINGVINDPILLNSVDNYIKEKISDVIKCKFVEKLDKIKIEVLQNSDQEIDSVNPRHLFTLIADWLRKEFDENRLNSEQLLIKTYMLYLNTSDRSLHDCLDIENDDHNYSEVIHEYKNLSRKLSTTKRSTENVSLNNGNTLNKKDQELNVNANDFIKDNNQIKDEAIKNMFSSNKKVHAAKPKQFLFTRRDSDSSLSSVADDDEQDWKILGIDSNSNSKSFINGLLMVAGKLYLVSVKLKIHSPNTTRNNSLDKPEIYSTVACMQNLRCALGAGCLNGKLVVCGGYDRAECLKTVEIYDAPSNKWTYLEPMKIARARFNVTVLDDRIYAIAGSDGKNEKELSSAEVYDSKEKCWKFISNCPIERSNAGVCSYNNRVYLIGGWSSFFYNGLQRCDVYDPATDSWERIADLKVGRYQVACCVLGGHIYAVGGCNYTCLNSVERYDPETNEWTLIEPMNLARRGCGVCSYENQIWVIGGHDGTYSLNSCEIFNPKKKTWYKGPSLQVCRANVGAVSNVENTIWVIGGFNGKTFLNTTEYLDIKNKEWTNFLRKDLNGQLKLLKERTMDNENDQKLEDNLNELRLKDEEVSKKEVSMKLESVNGDRKESKLSEFKKSKNEPLVEVEEEQIDQIN